ncbi:MAG: sigma-70 family RNA polymerase sigma factor [Myxococcales bacterium]|nr:MAG: sigma-70 family RNA polymerase sigma factor [Myxococcales bacterium]
MTSRGLHPTASPLPAPPDDETAAVNTVSLATSNREARRAEAEEDRGLIEAAREGDPTAFRKLVERHQRRAYTVALNLVRDDNDAREIVQEAFLRVYRGLATFQGGSSFFTWLYRIVTNLAIDVMRKPGRGVGEFDESHTAEAPDEADYPLLSRIDGADPLDALHRLELGAKLTAALEALPPYHRGVILMREVDGMSYDEMAQAMGVSKGTIMSRLFHARQKLQKALAETYLDSQGRVPPKGPASAADPSDASSPPANSSRAGSQRGTP